MAYETLLLDIDANVALLTLNRPSVLNALNTTLLHELDEAIQELAADTAIRAIILRGAGGKAFAAGADISELAALDPAQAEQQSLRTQQLFRRIETLPKPVLACIEGYALGGGCELAMACTVRLANSSARLGQPEIKLGLIAGYGGSQRLPRLVGRGAALKLLLTGAVIDATEAYRIGLIDELVEAGSDALLARALELAHLIASMPPLALAAAIESVDQGAGLPLDEALALEAHIFGRLCGTDDKREGTRAFLEKRQPVWSGR